jgi:hypothetical protein
MKYMLYQLKRGTSIIMHASARLDARLIVKIVRLVSIRCSSQAFWTSVNQFLPSGHVK